jgi:hypothetical protein
MTGKVCRFVVAGSIGLVFFLAFSSVTISQGQAQPEVDPTLEAYILNASVQIRMFVPYAPLQDHPDSGEYIMAAGLGTFSSLNGETVIVTHNHWGSALLEAVFVCFYDAQERQLLELSGADFRELIRAQDAGTLILNSPQLLVAPQAKSLATIGEVGKVTAGSILLIAHQDPEQNGKVALLMARVDSLTRYKNLPMFKVHVLDGQPVISGDSGGGIWLEGKLVGNMCGRAIENGSEVGYVAQFP